MLSAVRAALVRVLEVDPGSVTGQSRFAEDLGADSLALVEFAELVEEALDVSVEDTDLDAFVTVGDAVAYLLARQAACR